MGIASAVSGFAGRVEFATAATPVRLARGGLITLGMTALPRATGLACPMGLAMARGLAPIFAFGTTPATGLTRRLAAFESTLWL